MELGKELFHGLPKIHEAPKCPLCHEHNGVIVSKEGIICGECYLSCEELHEDAIIQEAARIVTARGNHAC